VRAVVDEVAVADLLADAGPWHPGGAEHRYMPVP
jgi:hypothetical protein